MTSAKKKSLARSYPAWVFIAIFAVFLIKFRSVAVEGAMSGLDISLNVILCCVFPFMVISAMFVSTSLCGALGSLLGRGVRRLFGLTESGVGVVLLGLCGGCPSGAFAACELYEKGIISQNEAKKLILYTNNATPAFIIGYVGSFLGGERFGVYCWVCAVCASLLCGILNRGKELPTETEHKTRNDGFITAFVNAVSSSAKNTVVICGFVIFFSVAASCLSVLGLPSYISAALYGITELTGGVQALCGLLGGGRLACSVLCAVCCFSGFCVYSQVYAVCKSSGVPTKLYLPAKLLQSALGFLLSFAFYGIFFA